MRNDCRNRNICVHLREQMKTILKNVWIILLLATAGSIKVRAQTGSNTPADSVVKPGNKVDVFKTTVPVVASPGVSASANSTADPLLPVATWVIKCNPTILLRGQLPVYVEHKLNNRYSLEGAVGMTFEDYGKAMLEGKPVFQKVPNEQQLTGVCAKAAARYYTRKTALSEIYLSPEMDFTDYRMDVTGVHMSDGRYTSGKLRDQQDYFDLRFVLGFQNTENYDSDFYFDWYVGAGLRMGTENDVIPEDANPNAIRVNHTDIITPTVSLGVKVGLGL